ncbi:MAG: substrate-binding domain-containing protein, partial [Zoogloeaceae bacterium]|nr:substrate-binding domain-containing protein [Zoogloeaceae bacterium]
MLTPVVFLIPPVLSLACVAGLSVLFFSEASLSQKYMEALIQFAPIVVGIYLCFSGVLGYVYGRLAKLPEQALSRYGPFFIFLLYTLGGWLILLQAPFHGISKTNPINVLLFLVIFLPYLPVTFMSILGGSALFLAPVGILLIHVFFMAAFTWGSRKNKRFPMRGKKSLVLLLILFSLFAVILGTFAFYAYRELVWRTPHPIFKEEMPPRIYWETHPEGKWRLISPRQTPSLQITQDFPRLDGATAFFPFYAAAARAIYQDQDVSQDEATEKDDRSTFRHCAHRYYEDDTFIHCSTTPRAYERLIEGETEMIFVFAPSEAQRKKAAEKGLTLQLTPIAREAFVFLTHAENPVGDLKAETLRAIYSGQLQNWREVGGHNAKILAFQRNENSGSQTVMQEFMQGTPLRPPLQEEIFYGMKGLIHALAEYRNRENALGYSFRFYATRMNPSRDVRLLSIDGIAPSEENIRNRSYPLIHDVYIVTARPLSENAQKLRDWFLSAEGQQLIADVGYVPL